MYCTWLWQEPLRVAMATHLRSLLQVVNLAGEALDQAVNLVTNDNLDLGCAVIEKSATEKVMNSLVTFFCAVDNDILYTLGWPKCVSLGWNCLRLVIDICGPIFRLRGIWPMLLDLHFLSGEVRGMGIVLHTMMHLSTQDQLWLVYQKFFDQSLEG